MDLGNWGEFAHLVFQILYLQKYLLIKCLFFHTAAIFSTHKWRLYFSRTCSFASCLSGFSLWSHFNHLTITLVKYQILKTSKEISHCLTLNKSHILSLEDITGRNLFFFNLLCCLNSNTFLKRVYPYELYICIWSSTVWDLNAVLIDLIFCIVLSGSYFYLSDWKRSCLCW